MLKLNLVISFLLFSYILYLNTSHVKVKLSRTHLRIQSYIDLNTSHVKVKLIGMSKEEYEALKFKYISC